MDLESTIAARRREIEEQARCKACGTPLADCRRIQEQGADGVGCCAGVQGAVTCHHPPSIAALQRLLDEIETGEVKPPAGEGGSLHDQPRRVSIMWLLHQDEWWQPQGRPMLRIAEMNQAWRHNTAAWLLRRARALAEHAWASMVADASGPLGPSGDMACDAFETAMDQLDADPEGWLCETPLYRALIAGLPAEGSRQRAQLAERARHYSTCPRRHGHGTCTCQTD